jgi:hypothetical protein
MYNITEPDDAIVIVVEGVRSLCHSRVTKMIEQRRDITESDDTVPVDVLELEIAVWIFRPRLTHDWARCWIVEPVNSL